MDTTYPVFSKAISDFMERDGVVASDPESTWQHISNENL
jgi:hypothetical protein